MRHLEVARTEFNKTGFMDVCPKSSAFVWPTYKVVILTRTNNEQTAAANC